MEDEQVLETLYYSDDDFILRRPQLTSTELDL